MKLELTVGVYDGDDLVDTVCYVVPVEPIARILNKFPEDSVGFSLTVEDIKELYE